MQIDTKIYPEKQLTLITVIGSPSFEESMIFFKQFYEGKQTKNVLWDFSNTSLSRFLSNHIQQILEYIQQYAEKRVGGKSGILVSRELEFGMSRMIQALTELKGIPIKIEIFKSIEEAFHWLDKDK